MKRKPEPTLCASWIDPERLKKLDEEQLDELLQAAAADDTCTDEKYLILEDLIGEIRLGRLVQDDLRLTPPPSDAETEGLLRQMELRAAGNPTWIWSAIMLCLWRPKGKPAYPLPDWCIDYLARTAFRLDCLARRADFRSPALVKKRFGGGDPDIIAAAEAADLVPLALEFVRGTTQSVWHERWNDTQDRVAVETYNNGIKRNKLRDRMLESVGGWLNSTPAGVATRLKRASRRLGLDLLRAPKGRRASG